MSPCPLQIFIYSTPPSLHSSPKSDPIFNFTPSPLLYEPENPSFDTFKFLKHQMELSGLDRQLVSPIPRPEEMDTNSCEDAEADEKKARPPPEHAVKCPRCDSGNTKFCYYNNYSLSQPRYFCKACRRYWTKGGTLRNVPVGGGCRKNKRSAKRAMDSQHRHLIVQSQVENVLSAASSDQYQSKLPLSNFSSPLSYDDSGTGDGLSLAFARLQKQCSGHLGFEFDLHNSISGHHQQAPVFGNPVGGSISLLDQQRSGPNLGFLSNFFEPQTTSFNSQNLYNFNGFEDGGAQNHQSHTQPLLPGEDLSLSNVPAAATEGFTLTSAGSVKQEMCSSDLNDSRILWGFPWQMSNNGEHENNNLVLGSNYSYNNVGNEYEVGGGRESWNNTGLAAAPTWPNLINSALM